MAEAAAAVSELEALKERVAHLEKKVDEVDQSLRVTTGGILRFSDKRELRAVMERVLRELGVPEEDPGITPEELQQRMVEDGVDPDECIASREIIATREAEGIPTCNPEPEDLAALQALIG